MKNSKIIILILLLINLTQFSFAQGTDESSKLRLGVKGGVNFSNIYTQNVEDNSVLIGFNVGVFAKLPLTKSFAVQP